MPRTPRCICGHKIAEHTYGYMMVKRPDCTECNCKSYQPDFVSIFTDPKQP